MWFHLWRSLQPVDENQRWLVVVVINREGWITLRNGIILMNYSRANLLIVNERSSQPRRSLYGWQCNRTSITPSIVDWRSFVRHLWYQLALCRSTRSAGFKKKGKKSTRFINNIGMSKICLESVSWCFKPDFIFQFDWIRFRALAPRNHSKTNSFDILQKFELFVEIARLFETPSPPGSLRLFVIRLEFLFDTKSVRDAFKWPSSSWWFS